MKNNTIIQANIENLTSLWKLVSLKCGSYTSTSNYNLAEINNSEWPNRLWFDNAIDEKAVSTIKETLIQKSVSITIPVWNLNFSNSDKYLENQGFKIKFSQIGMSLKPQETFEIDNELKLIRVTTLEEAKLWSKLFSKSFGYTISFKTLETTLHEIEYYIVIFKNTPVGTAILYKTASILGVHSVGIIPEMRKKGYAEQVMKFIINMAVESTIEYITLQASDMGKHLYLKLGFKEQFIIKNYVL